MATTVNKGYELQVTGSNAGTWGGVLNSDVIQIIDNNLGGITNKTLTNVNVVLSASESQNAILRLTGTLTGNVQITTSCVGFFFVENLCTGSFDVTITNGVAGVVVPRLCRTTVIADTTNGCRLADQSLLPSGTTMLFVQTNAPTGWTKSAAHNNKALRVVSGTAASGGSATFTDVFAARTILQANLPNVSFTGTAASSGSDHVHTIDWTTTSPFPAGSGSVALVSAIGSVPGNMPDASTNSSGAHTHTVSVSSGGSGTAMDFAVAYVDVIVAIKD